MPSTAVPLLMTDPGYLFTAPVLTAFPVNTVVGSVFTDAWGAPWASLGATEDGSDFTYASKVEPIMAAEFFDPLIYRTTERSGSMAFVMLNWTLGGFKTALNGGTRTVVSGASTTLLTSYTPPAPGSEVRCMIGWESLDGTTRIIIPQALNGAEIKSSFKKAPAKAGIATDWKFEVPASGFPFSIYTAGVARAG